LIFVFLAAYYLRTQVDHRSLLYPIYLNEYFVSFAVITPVWILVFATLGLYTGRVYNRRLVEWSHIILGSFIGILLVIGWEYFTRVHIFPARLVTLYVLVGSSLATILAREIIRQIRNELYRYGRGVSRVMVIGNSDATADIIKSLGASYKSGYQIVAFAGPARLLPPHLGISQFSHVEEALKHIKKMRITTIIQTDLYDSDDRNHEILSAAQINHIQYSFIPGEPEFYTGKNTVDVFLGYPMISVSQTPLIGWGDIAKRIFDFIVSCLLIIILSPLFLVLIILQKLFNPGPVFYISKRLSRFSIPVDLVKFRSMRPRPTAHLDAADEFLAMGRLDLVEEYKKNHKIKNDPRITKFGKFLRATSLDEIPQIFNVIRGDLSLVGPRPILPQEVKFSQNRTALLHSVRSGVTGLWQVSGRSDLSFEERIELELYYAQNWSFWMDIRILFKTIKVVFLKTGAK
ncbi:MAG: sugar transferase, partial [Candidatus Saccharimonas sp.]